MSRTTVRGTPKRALPSRLGSEPVQCASSLLLALACVFALATSATGAPAAPPKRVVLTVQVVKDGDGTGFVSTNVGACRAPSCRFSVKRGAKISLTARPGANSQLGDWSGACTGTTAKCALTVRRAQTATARFTVSSAVLAQRKTAVSNFITAIPPMKGAPETREKTGPQTVNDIFVPDSTVPAGQVRYHCTTQPYKLSKNPEKIVTLNPDAGKMWLGALLQGDGYQGGLGSLKALPINKRGPLTIFIDVLDPNATRTIEHPTAATVKTAIAEMVRSMDKENFPFPTVAYFRQTTASTIDQGLLDLGFSVKYLGFKADGSLNTQHKTEESTLMASLEQRYFTVSIVTPDTPADFFDLSSFTAEDLKTQQQLGRIGPNNPPVVVSSISYGRSFVLTVTAKTTEDRLAATLNAAFSAGHVSGQVNLTTEQKKILADSRIEVISNGGGEEAFREAVKAGNIKPVLDRPSTLSTAVPISFQVDNLGDNSAAKFAETSEYNLRTCDPVEAKTVVVGEIGKLSNLRTHNVSGCNVGLYGTLYVNGSQVWNQPRGGLFSSRPVVNHHSYYTFPTLGWPTFIPPDPNTFHLNSQDWSDPNAVYLTRFTDPRYGTADPQFHVQGNLTAYAALGGEPVNAFDWYFAGPFTTQEVTIPGGSKNCPMDLIFNITHVADLKVIEP